jgi:hypothetical protein
MDKAKLYLETLSSTFIITILLLSLMANIKLEEYMSFIIVGYFAVTALFKPRLRTFNIVAGILFIVFCYIVIIKIINGIQI